VLRAADAEWEKLERRTLNAKAAKTAKQDIFARFAPFAFHRLGFYFGSGTVGTVYAFFSASWYSPNSCLMPSNSFFTAER